MDDYNNVDNNNIVTLISSDSKKYYISEKAGMKSGKIKQFINKKKQNLIKKYEESKDKEEYKEDEEKKDNEENKVNGESKNNDEFLSISFKGDILDKVVKYLEHYENEVPTIIEHPLPSTKFNECVCEWDNNYMDIDLEMILSIILAASDLEIPPLLELASAKLAYNMNAKSTEEIQNMFGIKSDFTDEEKEQIMECNKWCLENL